MHKLFLIFIIKGCSSILCCDCPSGCAECLNQKIQHCPLKDGLIQSRFIRNTNIAPVYDQVGGTCYAYAACSAYINTIFRIYGSKPPPSFDQCITIAAYNGGNGGYPDKSIELLENHFHYGVKVEIIIRKPSIKEIMTHSFILSFATSIKGWENIANGSLIVKPEGETDSWHASLLEGFDFKNNTYICKNSWGDINAKPRFDVEIYATHAFKFYKVYFTLDSILNKTSKQFEPKIEKCNKTLYNKTIKAAWMDKLTATYNDNYVCEFHPEKKDNLNYLGYDIDEYISLSKKKWGITYNSYDIYVVIGFIGAFIIIVFIIMFICCAGYGVFNFLKMTYELSDLKSVIFLCLFWSLVFKMVIGK